MGHDRIEDVDQAQHEEHAHHVGAEALVEGQSDSVNRAPTESVSPPRAIG